MTPRRIHGAALWLLLCACTPSETPITTNPPPADQPIPSTLPPASATQTAEPKPLPPPPYVTPSGLEITVLRSGPGAEVHKGDMAVVHYVGTLVSGSEFDSSRRPDRKPFKFRVGAGQVIRGWDEGVDGMHVGEVRRLKIPPDLAYGSRGQPSIPPNSTLLFEIELLGVE